MLRTQMVRRGVAVAMGLVVVASVTGWWLTRDSLPEPIRIATARRGGLYHRLGEELASRLRRSTGHAVEVVETEGSLENVALLRNGLADLAIHQDGATDLESLARLAPLYAEVCHLLVNKDSPARTIEDLDPDRLVLGAPRSGMRQSAINLLARQGLEPEANPITTAYFGDLPDLDGAEGALVTTGLINPDLARIVRTGRFRFLPIPRVDGLIVHHPHFRKTVIPAGVFGGRGAFPASDIPSVATTAFLIARQDTDSRLVSAALAAIYETDLARAISTLVSRTEAAKWEVSLQHPAAQTYFNPFGGLDVLSNFMESLSAFKELFFALLAGAYLVWTQWRRLKERERQREVDALKERLDGYLEQTVRIERAQMETRDIARLETYLDDVTRIKLAALDELTHEDLRGDQTFAIFLAQCANLIRKIQSKIQTYS